MHLCGAGEGRTRVTQGWGEMRARCRGETHAHNVAGRLLFAKSCKWNSGAQPSPGKDALGTTWRAISLALSQAPKHLGWPGW